ncbi:NADP-dependent 3-hydroxy acid dehydrogenase YdfG [Pseudomonas duriflava]|uniref:NADP-dependent 3-hydroxy acid dehydrogenase YdfG n=1 Tax=Pseudomonas duriflava TaxID=459528 RepID=A0A562QLL0_9PSED|nr:SDR family oxidoreductase [Pseudomonas duriflava]TWI57631.1 NADP-dependent 3-hydroxy acid dehydrogenase YdfG [Pseudomonas duriflava]
MTYQAPVVVITGGTAGVGRATAVYFAQAGYRVAVLARGQQGLDETVAELQALGTQALACQADVADAAQVEQAAERVEAELGPIHVWVNAAMNTVLAPFSDVTPDEFKRVTEVTYLGSVHGMMAALKRMQARNSGTIVQVGSALAYRSIPLQSAYCGAKAATRGFIDSLRSELIHDKSRVRLTMVHLPGVNTPQFDWARNKLGRRAQPVPPIYQPEVAARAIFDAAMRAPREIWVSKTTIQSILGNMVAPGLLDVVMAKQAYEGQMTGEVETPGRPDYLDQPVEGLHRTHGRFSPKAQDKAITVDSDIVGMAALAVAGVGLMTLSKLRRLKPF